MLTPRPIYILALVIQSSILWAVLENSKAMGAQGKDNPHLGECFKEEFETRLEIHSAGSKTVLSSKKILKKAQAALGRELTPYQRDLVIKAYNKGRVRMIDGQTGYSVEDLQAKARILFDLDRPQGSPNRGFLPNSADVSKLIEARVVGQITQRPWPKLYSKDDIVSYDIGTVNGIEAQPAGGATYLRTHSEVQGYSRGGLRGVRVVPADGYEKFNLIPPSPARPSNIHAENPKVNVSGTLAEDQLTYLHVTYKGPRNDVLDQILKVSNWRSPHLKNFQDMYPLALVEEELPKAVERRIEYDKATLAWQIGTEQQVRLAQQAAKRRLEEDRANQRIKEEVERRWRQEEEQTAIREKDLPGFDSEVEFQIKFSNADHYLQSIPLWDFQIKNLRSVLENSKNLKIKEMKEESTTSGWWIFRKTEVKSVDVHLKGSYKDVADALFELAQHAVPEFRPGSRFSNIRGATVKEIIEHLLQAQPPKTRVKVDLLNKVDQYITNSREAESNTY